MVIEFPDSSLTWRSSESFIYPLLQFFELFFNNSVFYEIMLVLLKKKGGGIYVYLQLIHVVIHEYMNTAETNEHYKAIVLQLKVNL